MTDAPGCLVAIEGIDGCGKGTQARRLADSLRSAGVTVESLAFPRYDQTRFGGLITRFLGGEFGPLDAVAPELAALLFAGDRFESKQLLVDALSRSQVVICDRYSGSNVAHQAGRTPDVERRDSLIRFLRWLESDLYAIPTPDVTIWLDLDPEIAAVRIAARASSTGRAIDIAETDISHLNAAASAYATLAAMEAGWQRVACQTGQTQRPVEEIASDIAEIVRNVSPFAG